MITLNTKFLNTCALGASKEATRYYLNGVFIHDKDGFRHYCATDGHILIYAKESIDEMPDDQKEPLPRDIILQFTKPIKTCLGRCEFVINDKFATVFMGDKPDSFNIIDGCFPDYPKVMPDEEKTPDAHEFCMFAPEYLKIVREIFDKRYPENFKMESATSPCLMFNDDEPFKVVLMPIRV